MSKTGEQIKKRRKQLGMSADELAEKLGVSRSTIFRYEKEILTRYQQNMQSHWRMRSALLQHI